MDYKDVELVIPGNHIDDWQKIRKTQWKAVKEVLKYRLDLDAQSIKDIKQDYVLGCEGEDPVSFEPPPLLGLWFCADQSEEKWQEIWNRFSDQRAKKWNFNNLSKEFLHAAEKGTLTKDFKADPYGAFGGLEKKLLDIFVRSKTYTDEKFELGGKNYRLIPWESPFMAFSYVACGITEALDTVFIGENEVLAPVSPFTPAQWMHELLISTFEYDFKKDKDYRNDRGITAYCKLLKKSLEDEIQQSVHENHLIASHKLIEIFEDDMASSHVRDIWIKVRDGKIK